MIGRICPISFTLRESKSKNELMLCKTIQWKRIKANGKIVTTVNLQQCWRFCLGCFRAKVESLGCSHGKTWIDQTEINSTNTQTAHTMETKKTTVTIELQKNSTALSNRWSEYSILKTTTERITKVGSDLNKNEQSRVNQARLNLPLHLT